MSPNCVISTQEISVLDLGLLEMSPCLIFVFFHALRVAAKVASHCVTVAQVFITVVSG